MSTNSSEGAVAVAGDEAAQDRLDLLLSRIHDLTATSEEPPSTESPVEPVPPSEASAMEAPSAANPLPNQI